VNEPRRALAATLRHIDCLLGDGRSRDEVLDLDQLSIAGGEPQDVVKQLLAGEEPSAEDVSDRIVRRFGHLRHTRRRPDGSMYSYEQIAASFGATRARLSNLVNTWKKTQGQDEGHGASRAGGPLAATQAGIETFFFGEPNGWLSADPASALNRALQPVLAELREAAGQESYSDQRAYALRAARLPAEKRKLLEAFMDALEGEVREEQQGQ
jgi:hypothetical protein